MKTTTKSVSSRGGFTLGEMLIGTAVLGLLGMIFFQVLQSGLILSAKNTAVNAAHEETRQGIQRLTRDIHAAISVPQLRDENFAVISSTPNPSTPDATPPTAASVSFQNVAYGPNFLWKDPNPNGNSPIMIKDGAEQPETGMRLIVPFWGVEDTITKVTGASQAAHSNVWLANAQEQILGNKSPIFGGTAYAITYYTNRVMYAVRNGNYVADSTGDYTLSGGVYTQVAAGTGQYRYENGELVYYVERYLNGATYWKQVAVVARYLSTAKPFSVPLNRYGSSNNKYVRVSLSSRDPRSTNRRFVASASLIDADIDYRSRLTIYQ